MFSVSDAWRKKYPGAVAGILIMRHVSNQERHAGLDQKKTELEANLRIRFSGLDRHELEAIPPFPAYAAYYKLFKKTYHILLQLESIVSKGKTIPNVASLVESMFMAELGNRLLTAGHDLSAIQLPVRLEIASGDEHYVTLNGQDQTLKRDDMAISDKQGILSSVIYGPDQRTQIIASTNEVLYTVYAPPGIGEQAVEKHLQDIKNFVFLVSPEADVKLSQVWSAS